MLLTFIGKECAENRITTSSLSSGGNFPNSSLIVSANAYKSTHYHINALHKNLCHSNDSKKLVWNNNILIKHFNFKSIHNILAK